jgi:DnaJ-class molecular chaperone
MFCSRCGGTGELYGNGMVRIDCSTCDGYGSYEEKEVVKPVRIDKKSKAYKDAIKEIMALNPETTREEAVKLFEETYNKV